MEKKITTIEELLNLKCKDEVILYPTRSKPVDFFPSPYPITEVLTRIIEKNDLDLRRITFQGIDVYIQDSEDKEKIVPFERQSLTYAEIIESGRYWIK
ncbi:hypothetical protein SIO70_11725 [Chitinophaga sancti]|uniref:hypothetical protein n=1 Tax=Chitinophaga sancti TaxID=1004 RepID=UPI002A7598CE|nr:hypothetical protein [Chitinophaga sancti]WPQ65517.1 hypothetical protein SIO70_11725 [Chitinophaga sancti]